MTDQTTTIEAEDAGKPNRQHASAPSFCSASAAVREFHVLSLGAGVQSTTLYLMIHSGELAIPLNCAIFADTGEEPGAVYEHIRWLESLGGPPIFVRSKGKLGDDLKNGVNSTGGRFASIPAFTAAKEGGPVGQVKRQCTSEYKLEVIERFIRRQVLGLEPRRAIPKDVVVHQYIGFSFDEAGRAARARRRECRWSRLHFPLFDEQMKRMDCVRWLESYGVPHVVPRSACVFCPFRGNAEWRNLRDTDPAGWARAVEIDEALRIPGNVVNRQMEQKMYLHRSARPLEVANLGDDQPGLFDMECEGGCGL